MIGKVLIGLLVAAGLFLVYSLLTEGSASASTSGGTGAPRPLDKSGTFQGAFGQTKFVKYDAAAGRAYTDKGTFFSKTTPNVELKSRPDKGFKTGDFQFMNFKR
jgi:hypothetical protein